jgi:hypothetical protein
MEFYLKELLKANESSNCHLTMEINFRNETLTFDVYDASQYNPSDQCYIIERFFFKYMDFICDHTHSLSWYRLLDHLFAGTYQCLSINIRSYLFESLERCSPKDFLPWIDQVLANDDNMSNINIQAFTTYVDMKRQHGLTRGEIRYTILCESSTKLMELILSKIYCDRLVSKHVWLAIFRLKQNLSMTSIQKDMFNDWLGLV